jgi:hypothetical protein
MTEDNEIRQINIEIQVDDITAQGQYVNMVVATHSSSEFLLDFIFIPPGQTKARVRSRVLLAPEHAKRLRNLLAENIANFERRFGEIKLPEMALGPNLMPPKGMQ